MLVSVALLSSHHVLNSSPSDDLLQMSNRQLFVLFLLRNRLNTRGRRSRDRLLNLLQEP